VAGTSRSEYISDIFCVTGRLRLCTRIRRSPVTKKIQWQSIFTRYCQDGIDFLRTSAVDGCSLIAACTN
jgi:hypothetical protein